jgi:hypothetical protein
MTIGFSTFLCEEVEFEIADFIFTMTIGFSTIIMQNTKSAISYPTYSHSNVEKPILIVKTTNEVDILRWIF